MAKEISYFFKEKFLQEGVVSFPLFSPLQCIPLLEELKMLTYTQPSHLKGSEIHRDYMQSDILRPNKEYPEDCPEIRMKIDDITVFLKQQDIMSENHGFNSIRAHWYKKGTALGIGPHSDGKRFRSPIVIFIIRDSGEFCVHTDKYDQTPTIIPAPAGHCIVLDHYTIHSVKNVANLDRYTVTARFDQTPGLPW